MQAENHDLPVAGLVQRFFEKFGRLEPRVDHAVTRHQHFIRHSFHIRLIPAVTGQLIASLFQDGDPLRTVVVTGISVSHRARNAVQRAFIFDVGRFRTDLLTGHLTHLPVTAAVVPDLEAHFVQLPDLIPAHILGFVLETRKFANVERRAESVFMQQRSDHFPLARRRIVERQHDDPAFQRLQAFGRFFRYRRHRNDDR